MLRLYGQGPPLKISQEKKKKNELLSIFSQRSFKKDIRFLEHCSSTYKVSRAMFINISGFIGTNRKTIWANF